MTLCNRHMTISTLAVQEARFKMSQERRIFRQDRPPMLGKVHHVIKVLSTSPQGFAVCSEAIQGYWTHWNGKRTTPCFGGKGKCDGCKNALSRRWKGFLFVQTTDGQVTGWLELTPLAAERLLNRMPEGAAVRGIQILVFRERAGKKSPLAVEIAGVSPHALTLPPAPDVEKTLHRLWDATHLS